MAELGKAGEQQPQRFVEVGTAYDDQEPLENMQELLGHAALATANQPHDHHSEHDEVEPAEGGFGQPS